MGRFFGRAQNEANARAQAAADQSHEDAMEAKTEYTYTVAGGKVFTQDHLINQNTGQHYHGICADFTGIVNNVQYVNGAAVPPGGGHWDMDGFHHENGNVYK